MAHDVFISYSSKDKTIADAVCAKLEESKIRVWIAPRDIPSGMNFAKSIIQAINTSKVLILIWSANANASKHVLNEINQAFDRGITIIPFRIQDIQPTDEMRYYFGRTHWLDAIDPPLENHIIALRENIKKNLSGEFIPTTQKLKPKEQQSIAQEPVKSSGRGRKLFPWVAGGLTVLTLIILWFSGILRGTRATDISICQLTNEGGVDDLEADESMWKGIEQAKADFGVQIKYLESPQRSDFEVNLETFVEEGCDLIISGSVPEAGIETATFAKTHSSTNFAIIDYDIVNLSNVRGNTFEIEEMGFLAGYLAAGITETGKVGTYVGFLIFSTEAYLDGYATGVAYYNKVHGTTVEVIGWEPETQKALVVGNWNNIEDGRALGESLLDQGVDVIFPIAGQVSLGTLAIMQERGIGYLIGIDWDWSKKYSEYADHIIASVIKNHSSFVYDSIEKVIKGNFIGGENFSSNLENNGIEFVYGTAWADKVPDQINDEINGWIPKIISGEILVSSKNQ